jgi:hypothetical protein
LVRAEAEGKAMSTQAELEAAAKAMAKELGGKWVDHCVPASIALGAAQAVRWPRKSWDDTRSIVPDRRRMRADQLTACIMHALSRYMLDTCQSRAASDLFELLYEKGIEVITDQERSEAGLQPRNAEGLTPQDLHALELHRMQVLTSPFIQVKMNDPLPLKEAKR